MNYEEFATYKPIKPALTNFARGYELTTGEQFYVESWFYTQFTRIEERFPERAQDMVDLMIRKVKKFKYVVFTRDFEITLVDDLRFIAVEIDDIIAELDIRIDDNSRGSDYGD
ncbi:MAG TPA: hypothetical protein VJZ51_06905 [Bacilli bacterium]|nr:hypothetical protein [Bacilli bacterium]